MAVSRAGRAPGVDVLRSGLDDIRALRHGPISWPRLVLAAKAAGASVLAWYLALLIPVAEQYAYFAPLGAVVATTFSVAESLRQCFRALLAIGLGGALGLACNLLIPVPGVAVGVMVLAGVLVGAWRSVGSMGQWVPFTALFVVIVGGENPGEYAASYAGLTLLGGTIATIVNITIPPVPMAVFGPIERRIVARLADHCDSLADWLTSDEDEWSRHSVGERQVLVPLLVDLWDAIDRTVDARRINPRARRHTGRAHRQYANADRLERLIYLAQEIGELVSQGLDPSTSEPRLDGEEKEQVARALTTLADCLRHVDVDLQAPRERLAVANRDLREMDAFARDAPAWLVGSIAVSIRRSLQLLVPGGFRA